MPNAGFVDESTNGSYTTWLPIPDNYHEINVHNESYEAHSSLGLFRDLMELRKDHPILEGDVFFPYHDKDIFTFLRYVYKCICF